MTPSNSSKRTYRRGKGNRRPDGHKVQPSACCRGARGEAGRGQGISREEEDEGRVHSGGAQADLRLLRQTGPHLAAPTLLVSHHLSLAQGLGSLAGEDLTEMEVNPFVF